MRKVAHFDAVSCGAVMYAVNIGFRFAVYDGVRAVCVLDIDVFAVLFCIKHVRFFICITIVADNAGCGFVHKVYRGILLFLVDGFTCVSEV